MRSHPMRFLFFLSFTCLLGSCLEPGDAVSTDTTDVVDRTAALSAETFSCLPQSSLCPVEGLLPVSTAGVSDDVTARRGLIVTWTPASSGYAGTTRLMLRRGSRAPSANARLVIDVLPWTSDAQGLPKVDATRSVARGFLPLGDLPCLTVLGGDPGSCEGVDVRRDVVLIPVKAPVRLVAGTTYGLWLRVDDGALSDVWIGRSEAVSTARTWATSFTRKSATDLKWAASAPTALAGSTFVSLQLDTTPTPRCDDKVRDGLESDVDCGAACSTRCTVGKSCGSAADCLSGICRTGRCLPATCGNGQRDGTETGTDCGGICPVCSTPSCSDQLKNGTETDIDCGGTCSARCVVGNSCAAAGDCGSGVCTARRCAAPTCSDRARNGAETDVDCGSACAKPCAAGKGCAADADCATGNRCTAGRCEPVSCATTCGKSCVQRCAVGTACTVGADCASGTCHNKTCIASTCVDGVKNGDETDVDCGGSCVGDCDTARACVSSADCRSGLCARGRCVAASCSDGVRNGFEADVDCGGACSTLCMTGRLCLEGGDCLSGRCEGGLCVDGSRTDGIRNGAETDHDCGGGTTPCAPGRRCVQGSDCSSGTCTAGLCTGPLASCPSGQERTANGTCRPVELCPTGDPRCARVRVLPRVVAANPERFGTNIGDVALNNWTRGGEMEGSVLRYKFYATSASGRRIVIAHAPASDVWQTIASGFFEGGHVRVYRDDPANHVMTLIRTGTVVSYRAVPGVENWLDLDSDGAEVQAHDIVFIDHGSVEPPRQYTHPRMAQWAGANDAWLLRGPGTRTRDTSTFAPADGSTMSLRLDATGSGTVSASQYRYYSPEDFADTLLPGKTYRVSVWLKQSGLASGQVRFGMSGAYRSVQHTFDGVGADWARFEWDFVAPAAAPKGYPTAENILQFEGPGTVWIDSFYVFDPQEPVYGIDPAARAALRQFKPGSVRVWSGHENTRWGTSLDDWTSPETVTRFTWDTNQGASEGNHFHLPTALPWIAESEGIPWLIVGPFFSEDEWLRLIEYLAGPDTTPMGARRAAQGQVQPWTTVFPKIRLEFGNESWNGMFAPWMEYEPERYGRMAEHFFQVAQSSPYFDATRFEFILNGWILGDTATGYGVRARREAPSARWVDITAYTGGWELGGTVGGDALTDEGFWNTLLYLPMSQRPWLDNHVRTRDQLHAQGVAYDLAVYEGGPSYGLPNPGMPFNLIQEAYGKSLANGTSTLDCYLYASQQGVGPQAFFLFQGSANWASYTSGSNGFRPHTAWQALELRNRLASGDMVATQVLQSPGRIATVRGVPTRLPLVSSYAFRDGDRWTVFLLSRQLDATTPVTVDLPITSAQATLHVLSGGTGGARATNIDALNVTERVIPVGTIGSQVSLTLPPGAVSVLVLEDAVDRTPPSTTTATIGLSSGQPIVTTDPTARFRVAFDRPVSTLAATAVQVSGSAVDPALVRMRVLPADTDSFDVEVSGLSRSGNVRIVLDGQQIVTDDGASGVAVDVLADTVRYVVPLPRDVLFAWDDFEPVFATPPKPTPASVWLDGQNTGHGWTGPWRLQAFDANNPSIESGRLQRASGTRPVVKHRASGNAGGWLFTGMRTLYSGNRRTLSVADFLGYIVPDSNPLTIGQAGKTLWASVLLRKEANDHAPVYLNLGKNQYPYWKDETVFAGFTDIPELKTAAGRHWGLLVRRGPTGGMRENSTIVRTPRPLVPGKTALIVLRFDFGPTDTVSMWVDPESLVDARGQPLAPPDAQVVTDGTYDVNFHSVELRAGSTAPTTEASSADGLRFGESFRAVTTMPLPTSP